MFIKEKWIFHSCLPVSAFFMQLCSIQCMHWNNRLESKLSKLSNVFQKLHITQKCVYIKTLLTLWMGQTTIAGDCENLVCITHPSLQELAGIQSCSHIPHRLVITGISLWRLESARTIWAMLDISYNILCTIVTRSHSWKIFSEMNVYKKDLERRGKGRRRKKNNPNQDGNVVIQNTPHSPAVPSWRTIVRTLSPSVVFNGSSSWLCNIYN